MANYERDNDEPRVFDGGDDDDDGEGSHLPVVIIIAILVLAAFGGVVWLAYNQGVARGRNDVPARIASSEAGRSSGDGGIKVYQQRAAGEEDEDAAKIPAPQAAQPAPAQPVQQEPQPQVAQSVPAPQAVEPAPVAKQLPPPPAKTAAVTPPPPAKTATVTPPPAKMVAAAPARTTVPPPAPAKPLAQQNTAAQTASASAPPPVATKPPARLGLAVPAAPVAAAPAPKTATPSPTATAAPAKAAAAKPVASGSYLLQIGAFKSEAEASTAWKAYQSKHAALLAGFGSDVQRVDLGDKGTWYRLRIASFPDKDTASALCDRLKAQNGACFLAH